ncbi:hypothetical protein Ancab_025987 [Ancistrocladus abbreviatus]
MSSNEYACYKHMVLLPDRKHATIKNLIRFFFWDDIDGSRLIAADNVKHKYLRRGIILFSLFLQILFLSIAEPMRVLGSIFERWVNILSGRGFGLDRESARYFSILGNMDTRQELDKTIRHGDGKYYAALAMMAAKLAYENKKVIKATVTDYWKMKFLEFYDFYNDFQDKAATQAFIFQENNIDNDMIILAFRGTEPFNADDWITDVDLSWCKIPKLGKVHRGFMKALGLKKQPDKDHQGVFHGHWPKETNHDPRRPLAYYTLRAKLRELLESNKKAKFMVTGHSLGGALAILFPAILALHLEGVMLNRLEAIYTYGQPRVGDETFKRFVKGVLKEHNIKYFRVVYGNDVVPRIPFDDSTLMYKHFGTCIHFNSFYKGKIVAEEEPHWFHFSPFGWWLRSINATWELLRAFIMPYKEGRDYREGWMLLGCRAMGILTPGFVAHGPQDYVNCTRLSPPNLFNESKLD